MRVLSDDVSHTHARVCVRVRVCVVFEVAAPRNLLSSCIIHLPDWLLPVSL